MKRFYALALAMYYATHRAHYIGFDLFDLTKTLELADELYKWSKKK